MVKNTTGPEITHLIDWLAKLPGLGPRSARRAAVVLLEKRDGLMRPLSEALVRAADKIVPCDICGGLDVQNPCVLCLSPDREDGLLCVVEHVGDIWALERAGMYRGRYHVLGGVLSALDGVRVDDLNIPKLLERASDQSVEEVILAMNATVDGQATAHYLTDRLKDAGVIITRLAHGVPIGGELDYLDDGTLAAALNSRRPLSSV